MLGKGANIQLLSLHETDSPRASVVTNLPIPCNFWDLLGYMPAYLLGNCDYLRLHLLLVMVPWGNIGEPACPRAMVPLSFGPPACPVAEELRSFGASFPAVCWFPVGVVEEETSYYPPTYYLRFQRSLWLQASPHTGKTRLLSVTVLPSHWCLQRTSVCRCARVSLVLTLSSLLPC